MTATNHATSPNFGLELDVVAPAQGSFSTTDNASNSAYGSAAIGGTSLAAPHVAALLLSQNSDWAPETVRRRIITTTDKPPPPGGVPYDSNGFEQHMGYGRINMYQALGGINTTTYYSASVYLYNSRSVLSNPSGTNPVARHVFAGNSGGTVDFSVQKGDPSGVTVTAAEVRIANPGGSTDTLSLSENVVSSTMSTYAASKTVLPQLDFAVGATTYVPEIVLTHTHGGTTKIPLPAYTVPGPVPVSLDVSVSPPTLDAGGTAVFTVNVRDGLGNAIVNVPISATLTFDPGGGSLSSTGGNTPSYSPVLSLSPTPGGHRVVFSINSAGYEGISATAIVTGLPRLILGKKADMPGTVCAGQALTYTVSWSKGGTSTVYGITITDTLPNGASYTVPTLGFYAQSDDLGVPELTSSSYAASINGPWTPGEPPDGTGSPLIMRWTVDRLAPGHSGYLQYSVLISATLSNGSAVWNRASATLDSDSALYTSGPASDIIASPGVLASRASSRRYASTGQWFPVTLTVTNTGGTSAFDVSPSLSSGPGMSLAEVIYTPSTLPVLSPGSSTNFTWTMSASGSGLVAFTATADGTVCGATPIQSASSVSATMQIPAVLAGSQVSALPPIACLGQQVRIGLTVTNEGEATAIQVAGIPGLAQEGGGAASLVSSPATVPSLPGGAQSDFTWVYTLTGAGPLAFTATVNGQDANSGKAIGTGPLKSNTVQSRQGGMLTATSWLYGSCGFPSNLLLKGEYMTITVTVTNTGGDDVVNIMPVMAFGSGNSLVSWASGPFPSGPVTLLSGMAQTFTWTYSASGYGLVSFAPSATGDTCSGLPVQASGSVSARIGSEGRFQGTFLAYPPMREVGQPVTTDLTVTNSGDGVLTPCCDEGMWPDGWGTGVAVITTNPPAPVAWDPFPGGGMRTKRWIYTATSAGRVNFSKTITGTDCLGTVSAAYGGYVDIYPAGSLSLKVVSVDTGKKSVFVGEAITLKVTIKNTGTVAIPNVLPAVRVTGGKAEQVGNPVGATLAPGESVILLVTIKPTGDGELSFGVGANGAEGSVYASEVSAGPVRAYGTGGKIIVYPNPLKSGSMAKFCGLAAGAKLTIYTLRGLKVWSAEAQGFRVEWDGRNDAGRKVAPGMYYWAVEGAGLKEKGTVVVE